MKKLFFTHIFFLSILFISVDAFAATYLVGIGYGKSKDEALKYALADISMQISVDVKSDITQTKTVINNSVTRDYLKHKIVLTSELPIFGYTVEYAQKEGGFVAKVTFDYQTVGKIYLDLLNSYRVQIDDYYSKAMQSDLDKVRYDLLKEADQKYVYWYKLSIIASTIGLKEIKPPKVDIATVNQKIYELQTFTSDLGMIADNIYKQLSGIAKGRAVFVNAPESSESVSVTPFAIAIHDLLKLKFNSTKKYETADLLLHCYYSPEKSDGGTKDFILKCNLEENGKIVAISFAGVSGKSCNTTPCFPTDAMAKLEKQFNIVVNSDNRYHGDFTTNYGKSGLVFNDGDLFKLQLKVNKESSYFIVGVLSDGRGYLLPLNSGENNQKFIGKITKDNVNKIVDIIDLKTAAPYGSEMLLLFAYDGDMVNVIPNYKYSEKEGYYFLTDSYSKAVSGIRGKLSAGRLELPLAFTTEK